MRINKERVLNQFQELIGIPCPSTQERQVADVLVKELQELGGTVDFDGETAVIGHHVRIYHGVTLGVRNFRKDEEGNLLKGGKRHPNIGDHVILYANATILGGDTTIASGTAVPANALILHTPETFL